ncbi:MAG: DUF4189 domain-containing protein [Acidobacteria bacterium]|nr:DUF4189 domain-containing protein [Acidobacteriota bacterium]
MIGIARWVLSCTGPVLIGSFLLGFPTRVSAQGSCLYECTGPECALFSNTTDLCMEIRAKCQARCGAKRSYGAIAYSAKDKGAGWSYGWDYQDRAEKEAIKNCSARGTACKLIMWYYNSCAAVAADGNTVAWGRDSTKMKAQANAMAECAKAGGRKCGVEVAQCSLK